MNAPEWILELTQSDFLLGVFALLVFAFLLDYGIFSPWWRHPIGWITIIYTLSVLGLMFLIVWGVIVSQRVDEWARSAVGAFLVLGALGKLIILHVSRYEGKIERRKRMHRHHKPHPEDEGESP